MRKSGPLIFPLSAAHITGLLALQAAAALAFISPALAALPLAADGSPDRKKIKDAHGGASG